MVTVRVAAQLVRFFPALNDQRTFEVQATTAAEVVAAMDAIAPGMAGYIVDERGRLRQHVNLFIGQDAVVDRATLADAVPQDGTVHILQALSGG